MCWEMYCRCVGPGYPIYQIKYYLLLFDAFIFIHVYAEAICAIGILLKMLQSRVLRDERKN